MQFVILRDRTGLAQATNEKRNDNLEKVISSLTPESTVDTYGQVVRDDRVEIGARNRLAEKQFNKAKKYDFQNK